jgi:hypothetical protein
MTVQPAPVRVFTFGRSLFFKASNNSCDKAVDALKKKNATIKANFIGFMTDIFTVRLNVNNTADMGCLCRRD